MVRFTPGAPGREMSRQLYLRRRHQKRGQDTISTQIILSDGSAQETRKALELVKYL